MHSWDISISEAVKIQTVLSKKIIIKGKPSKIEFIAGIDVAYVNELNTSFCAITIFNYQTLKPLDIFYSSDTINFKYIPGLLSFREGPVIIKTFKSLKIKPDLLMFDGHGIAHPRGFGLASHIGLFLGVPAIGCAKSHLYGSCQNPDEQKGSSGLIYDEHNNPVGLILRSRQNVKPIFVSPGHLIGIEESKEIVLNSLTKYKIPEPLRIADIEVNKYRKGYGGN
jgi:deoxyribonuclease V